MYKLLPSEIQKLKIALNDQKVVESTLADFMHYLKIVHIDGPHLDDVVVISIQLKLAGLWEKFDPYCFVDFLVGNVNEYVLEEVSTSLLPVHESLVVTPEYREAHKKDYELLNRIADGR